MTDALRVAVVGAGWAGLACAVALTRRGQRPTVFEMAATAGGRARSVGQGADVLDNGQHILIGAYRDTLALMRAVGVDPEAALLRLPMHWVYPQGDGLRLPGGPAALAFARGALGARGWAAADKAGLLVAAAGWMARGFRCPADWTVARLARGLRPRVQRDLIEPLCVAALNTPAQAASATVFLRVLHDALFSGRGGADLLLPRQPLGHLFPEPAVRWLAQRSVPVRFGHRVQSLQPVDGGWSLDGQRFDRVVLACPPGEAARLAAPQAAPWAATAAALPFEPIVTVYADSPGSRLPLPLVALRADERAPAQFVFDHGHLGGPAGRFAFVISGAAPWVERGLDATTAGVLEQAQRSFPAGTWRQPLAPLRTLAEKRATFACRPSLQRPPARIAPGLWAVGDHVAGPYPATLEGAVRCALAVADEVAGAARR
jgi:squalene-associated FAD-dependent desaturase